MNPFIFMQVEGSPDKRIREPLGRYGRLAPDEIILAFDFPKRQALEAWLEKMFPAKKCAGLEQAE